MRASVLTLGLVLTTTPALAQAVIAPCDAQKHVGEKVTVEGPVSDVLPAPSGRVTFIDMGGRYPNNCFSGVIFADDVGKFPNVNALDGKTVDITGAVRLYQGRAEIILNDPAQVKAK